MQTIKAIYDGTNFRPMQPIPVKENYEVFITFVAPVKEDSANITQSAKLPRSTAYGILKGKVLMSDDFNEPLEEMKEYME
jgi:predicted DNA-binding antitoxin AbrB/MazE fold protein